MVDAELKRRRTDLFTDSDAITKGIIALLIRVMNGRRRMKMSTRIFISSTGSGCARTCPLPGRTGCWR